VRGLEIRLYTVFRVYSIKTFIQMVVGGCIDFSVFYRGGGSSTFRSSRGGGFKIFVYDIRISPPQGINNERSLSMHLQADLARRVC
jgi:hypothetical protein